MSGLSAHNADDANRFVITQQRHPENAAYLEPFRPLSTGWRGRGIAEQIGHMEDCTAQDHVPSRKVGTQWAREKIPELIGFRERWWFYGSQMNQAPVVLVQRGYDGTGQMGRAPGDGVEHWLHVSRRAGNHAQDLRRR